MMRALMIVVVVAVGALGRARAFAEDAGAGSGDAPKWIDRADPKLGITFRHPADAKVAVKGGVITVSAPALPTVTITISKTTERGTAKSGGIDDKHVEWTIEVPKRSARCVADGKDLESADLASTVCDSIVLTPGARTPHAELIVSSTGLASAAGYEQKVRGKKAALDACWKKALAKDAELPEGSLVLARDLENGKPVRTNRSAENFFDHDAKPLGACVFPVVESVPAKTSAPAASVKVEVIFQLY
jgi:hypothetical protein